MPLIFERDFIFFMKPLLNILCVSALLVSSASASALSVDWGASFRLRGEIKKGLDFNDAQQDYALLRSRIGADIAFNSNLSLTAELQDARVFNVDANTIPNINDQALDQPFADDLDIHRLALNFQNDDFNIKLGRQKLNLGDKRLAASLEWVNTARVHDGLKIDYRNSNLEFSAFATELVSIDPNNLNDGADTGNRYFDSQFNGAFISQKDAFNVDLIQAWWFQRRNSAFNDDIHTFGVRATKQMDDWVLEGQASIQGGDFGGLDHQAAMAQASLAKKLGEGVLSLGLAWASGDDAPNDDKHSTFDNLYPLNHAYYGYLDLLSLQNLRTVELNYKRAFLNDKFKFRAALHGFWLDEKNDQWYDAGLKPVAGRLIAANRINNRERYLGGELDISAEYQVENTAFKGLNFLAGYSHFESGDRITADPDSGLLSNADFIYLQVHLKL